MAPDKALRHKHIETLGALRPVGYITGGRKEDKQTVVLWTFSSGTVPMNSCNVGKTAALNTTETLVLKRLTSFL